MALPRENELAKQLRLEFLLQVKGSQGNNERIASCIQWECRMPSSSAYQMSSPQYNLWDIHIFNAMYCFSKLQV